MTDCTHGVNVGACCKFYIPPYCSSIFSFCQLLYTYIKRVEMVQELSALAGVPFEDMLVHNIQEANIKGRDCLTASLWITGENGVCIIMYKFAYICLDI